MTPSEIGARAESEVACALERAGWFVYRPLFVAHSRVDLIALRSDEVIRMQVKTAREREGHLLFRTCSNTGNVPLDYRGQIDAFGVFAPKLERVYVVPVDVAPTRVCTLRPTPAASGQLKGIRRAADFELSRLE